MTRRRELSDMLIEIADGVNEMVRPLPQLRTTSVELTLPVEFALVWRSGHPTLLGDLPRWRLRTAFDTAPGQLRLVWQGSAQQ
jgi:hypothetical protein